MRKHRWLNVIMMALALGLIAMPLVGCEESVEDHRGDKYVDDIDPNIYPVKD